MESIGAYRVCTECGTKLTTDSFVYPTIPTEILELLEGIQIQSDVVSSLSVAAMGFVASLWIRRYWDYKGNAAIERWTKVLLGLSLLTLAASTTLGFVSGTYRVGYLAEVATGWNGSLSCYIDNARDHFRREYFDWLQYLAITQLIAFGAGILMLLLTVAKVRPPKGNNLSDPS